jgi:hypothetical protein
MTSKRTKSLLGHLAAAAAAAVAVAAAVLPSCGCWLKLVPCYRVSQRRPFVHTACLSVPTAWSRHWPRFESVTISWSDSDGGDAPRGDAVT